MKTVLATIGVILAGVAVLVGGYLGGWWLEEDVTQRTAEIREDTFARQTALQDEILGLYDDITKVDVQITDANEEQARALRAQREAMVTKICDAQARLNEGTNIPTNVERFLEEECR